MPPTKFVMAQFFRQFHPWIAPFLLLSKEIAKQDSPKIPKEISKEIAKERCSRVSADEKSQNDKFGWLQS